MKRKWKDSGGRLKYVERKERTGGWVRRKGLIQSDNKVRDFQELSDFLIFFSKIPRLGFGWLANEGPHLTRRRGWWESKRVRVLVIHHGSRRALAEERPGTIHSTGDRAEGREGWSGMEFRHRV